MRSRKWFVNLRDILHGFLMAFGGSVAAAVAAIFSTGAIPTWPQFKVALLVGLGVGLFYIVKNWLSNSNGELLKPEPPKQ